MEELTSLGLLSAHFRELIFIGLLGLTNKLVKNTTVARKSKALKKLYILNRPNKVEVSSGILCDLSLANITVKLSIVAQPPKTKCNVWE